MPQFHQQTKHSFLSVRKNAFFLDWRTQPKNFKKYPHFYQRYNIDEYEELKDLNLIGGISFEKTYPEGKYYLRTNPSAGALYPCEIYIQIRGIKGLLDGIYHYEIHENTLALLLELDNDGVEHYFKDKSKQKGIVFLISSVYFRSSWKYRDRSIRYILLDSGHQLGSIYATLCLKDLQNEVSFDFDKLALNEEFGFRDDEMFTVAISTSEKSDKEIKPLKQKLPFVSGCDFLETNSFVEDAYKQSAIYEDIPFTIKSFFEDIPKEQLKNAIINRRSIRAFRMQSITKDEFEFIVKDLFEFARQNNIELYYNINRVENMSKGVYLFEQLLKEGDFSDNSRYLALEQNLGGHSAVTFYFTSGDVEKYQKVNILSGFIAQIIYLRSELKGIGTSGIGAYYDDEAKQFLETKNNILYLLAIGK